MKYKLIPFLLLIFMSACSFGEKLYPSYTSLAKWIPSENIRVDVAVWYPTKRKPYTMEIEQWSFASSRNAKPAEGKFPVIIISHDTSGSRYSHHNLATKLTAAGFIVLAPQHSRDNLDNMDLFFTPQGLNLRANQISISLDLLLENKTLEPHVDRENITVFGFGSGGTAALLLANAELNVSQWEPYCQNQASANIIDPYCAESIRANMDNFITAFYVSHKQDELFALARENVLKSSQEALVKGQSIVADEVKRLRRTKKFPETPIPALVLPYFPPLPQVTGVDDNRIGSVILVSPGYFMLFDTESLANMEVQSLFIGLEDDLHNRPHLQSEMFAKATSSNPHILSLQDTSIPSLQAPVYSNLDLPGINNLVTEEERQERVENLYKIIMGFLIEENE